MRPGTRVSSVILSSMPLEFRGVSFPPLHDLTVSAPNGAVIGIVGEDAAGQRALLRLAAGIDHPSTGQVICAGEKRYVGLTDSPEWSRVDLLAIEHSLALRDAFQRAQAAVEIGRLRDAGATVLIVSHELELLQTLCDEVWWLESGSLIQRGDPREVLDFYRKQVAQKFRAWGETLASPMRPSLRRGDGRAEILSLETFGSTGKSTMVWQSGEEVTVRIQVRYKEPVHDPVIGILIRTRIGLEVYGTNTELENVQAGRCSSGDRLEIQFRFRCDLCPGEYTLTAASHDRDGAAHDWLDDAVAFVVADSRYTAGVANLKAKVEVKRLA
jgi:homopolymeric O-antigen transport system ATP-binding protein